MKVFLFNISKLFEIYFLLIKLPIKDPVPTANTKKVITQSPKEFIGYLGAKINGAIIKKDHKVEKKTGGDNHEKLIFFNIAVKIKRIVNGKKFVIAILLPKNFNKRF